MDAEPVSVTLPEAGEALDGVVAALPDSPAVFLLFAGEGQPYLSKTAHLARRVRRLMQAGDRRRAALNLRGVVSELRYWPVCSRLESAIVFYKLAREYFPETYRKLCNLRLPAYMRVLTGSEFPRTLVTTRPAGRGLTVGPFRTRASAEEFEHATLELFQVRRCQDDLAPSPDHPGCIYGEMAQCLRPCQAAVTKAEYASEVERLLEFLATEGRSLTGTVEQMRDRFSADMEFEEAARQHRRLEKIQHLWRSRDELAVATTARNGVAVVRAPDAGAVTLLFLLDGCWVPPVRFGLQAADGRPVSLDRRLREILQSLESPPTAQGERIEHVAILARWYYSSWRDGEWLGFGGVEDVSYRRLVNMIHRVAAL